MITIKRLNNENVLAADANQWPRLMLAILELAFLVRAGLIGQPSAYLFTMGATAVEHEQLQLVVHARRVRCRFLQTFAFLVSY